jgi:hypothetical protein
VRELLIQQAYALGFGPVPVAVGSAGVFWAYSAPADLPAEIVGVRRVAVFVVFGFLGVLMLPWLAFALGTAAFGSPGRGPSTCAQALGAARCLSVVQAANVHELHVKGTRDGVARIPCRAADRSNLTERELFALAACRGTSSSRPTCGKGLAATRVPFDAYDAIPARRGCATS